MADAVSAAGMAVPGSVPAQNEPAPERFQNGHAAGGRCALPRGGSAGADRIAAAIWSRNDQTGFRP